MKILVGYDGSNSSKAAVELAVAHAKAFGGEILLVTSLTGGSETTTEDIDKATEGLESAEALVKAAGVPCEFHLLVRDSAPGEDIVGFAEKNHVDEIIVGVRRRSKVGKLVFGSTAQFVILEAPCPVVSVK